jgi:hypothetical protein
LGKWFVAFAAAKALKGVARLAKANASTRDVGMSISGYKTDSMYSRYNICDLKRRRKALERVQEFRERMAVEQAQSNVIAMR